MFEIMLLMLLGPVFIVVTFVVMVVSVAVFAGVVRGVRWVLGVRRG